MNDQNKDEVMAEKRFKEMPKCVWTTAGVIRAVVRPDDPPYLEMLYYDGNESPFWGPLPVFYEPVPPPQPKVGFWRSLFSRP